MTYFEQSINKGKLIFKYENQNSSLEKQDAQSFTSASHRINLLFIQKVPVIYTTGILEILHFAEIGNSLTQYGGQLKREQRKVKIV